MNRYRTFSEFYPFYLSEHADIRNRQLHFFGTSLVLAVLLVALVTQQWWLLLATPLVGYGPAWVGHFVFEKNKPATFRYPLYSLMGDWVMYWHVLCGRVRIL